MVRPVTRTHRLAVSWVSASTHRRVRRPPARAHVRPPQGRRRPDQRDRSHVSDRRKRGLFCCCAAGVAEPSDARLRVAACVPDAFRGAGAGVGPSLDALRCDGRPRTSKVTYASLWRVVVKRAMPHCALQPYTRCACMVLEFAHARDHHFADRMTREELVDHDVCRPVLEWLQLLFQVVYMRLRRCIDLLADVQQQVRMPVPRRLCRPVPRGRAACHQA
eukprot:356547-Chlamydomonas_euryale.AAC.3